MKIVIKIKNKNIEILLKKGKKIFEKEAFPDERDLGERLILAVDKMLKKTKISISDVEKVEIDSDQSDSFTTTRLAKTFAASFNWAKNKI